MPVGGYLDLELNELGLNPIQHGVYVNSGRNALEYILRCIDKISTLYIPKFTCNAILEPIYRLGLNFKTYSINDSLEIDELPNLGSGDFIIINNYFGIKDQYVSEIVKKLGQKAIIDNSQAYYTQPDSLCSTFYSPRKFVGVPDGGIAFADGHFDIMDISQSWDIFSHLLKRKDVSSTFGYADFKANSQKLGKAPLMKMSALTKSLLNSIDFERIREKRKNNYSVLKSNLDEINLLNTPDVDEIACPLVYPFRIKSAGLRTFLIQNEIFIATYWPNIKEMCTIDELEWHLTDEILPLPIDQRYSVDEMQLIINLIMSYESGNNK